MRAGEAVVDQQTKYWRLRRAGLFDDLTDVGVRQLSELCEIRVIERGKAVYEVGDPSGHVYVIESGVLRLSRLSDDGRAVNIAVLGALEIFGELSLAGESSRLDTARALDDAVVCGFAADAFEAFLSGHPELALRVAKLIGRRLRRVETRIHDILFKDVRTRLAHTLARLADRFGDDVGGGRRIDLRLTQSDLAQLIGSTRETTSTIFNEFRRQGLVDNEGHYIILRQVEALRRY